MLNATGQGQAWVCLASGWDERRQATQGCQLPPQEEAKSNASCFVCINHTASFTERNYCNHSAGERGGGVGRLVTYPAAELSPNHILWGNCFHFECPSLLLGRPTDLLLTGILI